MVMRLPSRRRCTSLPSLTARRPKVDSAISAWRQNSEIWLRISSFFIAPDDWDKRVGSSGLVGVSYHHLPTLGNVVRPVASQAARLGDPAAHLARVLAGWFGPLVQRAQGRPGARCTRGLACKSKQ